MLSWKRRSGEEQRWSRQIDVLLISREEQLQKMKTKSTVESELDRVLKEMEKRN